MPAAGFPPSSTPVYAQIVDQIKRAIASGVVRSGDPLPSLRETALKLRINHLTISKAYKQLENERLIETRHGLGSFIVGGVETRIKQHRRTTLAQALDEVLVDACQLGVAFEEVKQLLDERIKAADNGFAREYRKERKDDGS